MKKYSKPTYEEYQKASLYARVRYRFGVYIQLIALALLLLLLFYTITNIEEMKANPKDYAEEKLGVICNPPILRGFIGPIQKDGNIGDNISFRKW